MMGNTLKTLLSLFQWETPVQGQGFPEVVRGTQSLAVIGDKWVGAVQQSPLPAFSQYSLPWDQVSLLKFWIQIPFSKELKTTLV